jgi:hypothetical protein
MPEPVIDRASSTLDVVRQGTQRIGYSTLNEIGCTGEMEDIAGRDHGMLYFGG